MGARDEDETRPLIILVPYPAHGHVTPMLRLARALHAHGFRPILAAPDFIAARAELDDDDDWVGFASIPTGLMEDDATRDFFAIERAMENVMPAHLDRLLRSSDDVACVVVDLLASWAIAVADRCGVPVAGFWPAMLATYRLISSIPELIRWGFISDSGTPLHRDWLIPGDAKLSSEDLPWLVGNPTSQKLRFIFWLKTLDRASSLRWLLINSFAGEGDEIDGKPRSFSDHRPRVLQIGPLLCDHRLSPSTWDADMDCIEWLGTQPPSSVVYVSFGSWVGPIGAEKIAELALGLEAMRRPFLWVLRDDGGGAWRTGLPPGFLDRVAGRGRVVGWAPQEEVLKHRAVGCFVTHCGWNSTLEAVRHGRRLLCYPISGDQFVNCAYIVRVWGIGVMLGDLERFAVADGVRRVMDGEEGAEVQDRVVELKRRVMGCVGSSRAATELQCFVDEI